jgi:hypothetical protein
LVQALRDHVRGLEIPEWFEQARPGRASELLASDQPQDWWRLLAEIGGFMSSEGDGDAWRRWLSLGEALGQQVEQAMATLSAAELHSLGLWGLFGGGPRDLGVAAYRSVLHATDEKDSLHTGQNVEYLIALFEGGRGAEIAQEHRLIHEATGRTPEEDLVLLAEQARSGDADARAKLEKAARDIDRPADQQALSAYLLNAIEPSREWGEIIARVFGERTIWKVYRAQFRRVPESYGIPIPEKAKDATPPKGQVPGAPVHVVEAGKDKAIDFGGQAWKVPPCAGCGHDTHCWFTLHPSQVPELAKWLSWKVAPLLACADCGYWMGVNRYEIDLAERRITLLESELAGDKKLAHAFADTPTPKAGPAKLRKVTAGAWKKIFEHGEPTVIAGKPPRLADYTWPRCRQCKEWMRYYGALGTDAGFEGMPAIANDGGYLLHFACVPCSRLTVVPNWS